MYDSQSYHRPIVWLFGLPFDLINISDSVALINERIRSKQKLNFVTPNLSFLRESNFDDDFRNAVISTDLSLADGAPVIWLAKTLGIKDIHRVAGSNLFERLAHETRGEDISVFFYGGLEGVAEKACCRINANEGAMRCVGSSYPGFGDVAQLSSSQALDQINTADPDFLVVSLGAKKGVMWINENFDKLRTPIVSHLGAVVNFVAGTVKRAPRFIQSLGFEWLWRIGQERDLTTRYVLDFKFLVKLVITSALPLLLKRKVAGANTNSPELTVLPDEATAFYYTIVGSLTYETCAVLEDSLANVESDRTVVLNMEGVKYIDAFGLGLLYHLKYRCKVAIRFENVRADLKHLVTLHRAEVLFSQVSQGHSYSKTI